MTARCASCNYPLTISDSVVCYECTSYFHIDCAQLVGFPFYPQRNTFHCSTCKLLPLPQPVDSDSDSDGEGDAMPSRQLDYSIEDRSDFTNEMNEIKGNIQDLSSLCKDMLREINELKSINLTLRCSIENLRHDSSRRDGVIADLLRRIEALESNKSRPPVGQEPSDWKLDGVVLEREEELERYSTPEPTDATNARSARVPSPVNFLYSNDISANESGSETSGYVGCQENDSIEKVGRENVLDNEPEIQDWTWKGNDAIAIDNEDDRLQSKNTIIGEERKERADGDHDWDEECGVQEYESLVQQSSGELRKQDNENEEEEDDEEDDSEEVKTQYEIGEMKLVGCNEEFEDSENLEEYTESKTSPNMEDKHINWEVRTELGSEVESIATLDERELSERLLGESLAAIDETSSLPGDDQEPRLADDVSTGDDRPDRLEGLDFEHESECALGETKLQEEGESHREEGPAEVTDGDVGLEEADHHEPLDGEGEGEAPQLSESGVEIVEPPAEPHHTEADLWDYLKDTVSSVHPSTVEEFLENLIGTLQHVPEEYFKPVIDANIRRATSPSVTDGEQLPSLDGTHEEGEAPGLPQKLAEEETSAPTDLAVDDGYMPLEGALLGAFWMTWLIYSVWGE